ncbi:MAG TPA: GNAT family N-acetyltransferase [Acidimicrobiales bacterium]|nr:GNAT family N-acetyltransferase [Acidimicrobiales bacterium]
MNTSAYVRDDLRGRGIGRRLYAALFKLLELQGYRRAYAGITLPNEASITLHRCTGFTDVGIYRKVGWKLGRWHDLSYLQKSLSDDDGPPVQPLLLNELGGEAIGRALAAALEQ